MTQFKAADDMQRLRLDFLPLFDGTVQNYGVLYKHLHYYSDVLKPWIDAPDPEHIGRKRKFTFRYDPRDMSVIYFYDPELQQYFQIPWRDSGRPNGVSQWELRAATRRVREAGLEEVNEDTIFKALGDLQDMEHNARAATLQQRKNQERRKRHDPVVPRPSSETVVPSEVPVVEELTVEVQVDGFDDVEVDIS